MKTVAITGAGGFIGGRLTSYLAERGYRVLAFGRRPAADLPAGVAYRVWDITAGPLRGVAPVDAVIHCAGSVSDWGTYAAMYRTNVIGTANVLATFADARHFIHMSTASVYDHLAPKPLIREDAPYPRRYLNAYGKTKMQAELRVKAARNPTRIIVRPHIVYGPRDTTLLPRLLRARRLGHFLVLGDGENRLSLTYIENLAAAIERMLDADLGCEVINIGDTRSDTVNAVLTAFLAALDIPEPLLHVNKTLALTAAGALERLHKAFRLRAPPLVTRYAVRQMTEEFTLDLSKAQGLLGYVPHYDYLAGFAAVGAWLRLPSN